MAQVFSIKNGKLQSNLDAGNFTILNLDLTGLMLTAASVGLGNVNNTSDLNKPLSTATIAALLLKEPAITAGTTAQVWRGDKTWLTYGAFMLQGAETTFDHISIIGANTTSGCFFRAKRSDFASSDVAVYLRQNGAAVTGTIIPGVNAANAGVLLFDKSSVGVINTATSVPIVFGTNNLERARILFGLSIGTTLDPGLGSILAAGTIAAGGNIASSATIAGVTGTFSGALNVGTTASVTGNATIGGTLTAKMLSISGEAGTGFIELSAQTVVPTTALAAIYADNFKNISFVSSLTSLFAMKFESGALTADRIFTWPNKAGTVAVEVAVPASAGASGVAGTIAYEAGFLYICVATNTWQRVVTATF